MPRKKNVYVPGIDLNDLHLNTKELNFIADICDKGVQNSFEHPEKSYLLAGFPPGETSEETREMALRILEKAEVQQALKRHIDRILEAYKERLNLRLTRLWEARTFWDPRDYFTNKMEVKPLEEIPEEALYAVDAIKVDYRGKDASQKIVNFDMANRMEASKQLQLFLKTGEAPKSNIPADQIKKVKDKLAKVREEAALGGQTIQRVTERVTETISVPEETGNAPENKDS